MQDLLLPPGEFHPQEHSDVMRANQVAAFKRIKEEGLLSRLRFLVYQAIYYLQGAQGVTSGELDRFISKQVETWTRSASPRLSELVRLGVIEEVGHRKCSITKQTVIEYRTTGNLPNPAALRQQGIKPSLTILKNGLQEMRILHRFALQRGYTPRMEYLMVGEWIEGLVRS